MHSVAIHGGHAIRQGVNGSEEKKWRMRRSSWGKAEELKLDWAYRRNTAPRRRRRRRRATLKKSTQPFFQSLFPSTSPDRPPPPWFRGNKRTCLVFFSTVLSDKGGDNLFI